MTEINYINRNIKLEECESIKVRGSRYQIKHTVDNGNYKDTTFIELNPIDNTEEFEKVSIYVNTNNIDTTIIDEHNGMSSAKKAHYEQMSVIRQSLETKEKQDVEKRFKSLEDLVNQQATIIEQLQGA